VSSISKYNRLIFRHTLSRVVWMAGEGIVLKCFSFGPGGPGWGGAAGLHAADLRLYRKG